jgi:hypothetical protein
MKVEENAFVSLVVCIRLIKSRRMSWAGHLACIVMMRNVCSILVGKTKGKRPFGIPRHKREDNIRKDFWEIGWEEWTGFIWVKMGTNGGLL